MEAGRARPRRVRRLAGALALGAALVVLGVRLRPALSTQWHARRHPVRQHHHTGGWKYDYYRNTAYPVRVSGYQTFVDRHQGRLVDTTAPRRCGCSCTAAASGYFDADGKAACPSTGPEDRRARDLARRQRPRRAAGCWPVRDDAAGFRTRRGVVLQPRHLRRCEHAPTRTTRTGRPTASPAPTNGVLATKAAVQFAQSSYPTTKTFLTAGARVRPAPSAWRGRCSCRASRRRASSPTRAS